ncbi:hypothetical protein [Longitalea luteola]|uniref:hypothetical protein n=1 Tax=Longitalea luteola TaxID=2812563 RepID=UPI001A97CB80|nr:hypothetical protein [Longitalea luteola]
MTPKNDSTAQQNQGSLVKRMLVGAVIGLLLISLFLITAGEPNPEWPKLWRIKPLIIVPLAGAMGGLCNYFLVQFNSQLGLHKAVAVIVSVIIFIIGLWLGTVLGLDGTYWN